MSPLVVLTPLWIERLAVRSKLRRTAVVRTGMGRAKSLGAASHWAHMPGVAAVAVAGVCGSLHAQYVPGDVIVASELRGHGAPRPLDSAKWLARAVESLGLRAHIGPILSVDRLAKPSERDSLARTGALAVDMESAWLGELADSVPFAVLRVVSDGPGHELFGPGIVVNGVRALRSLRAAAPALETWAASLTQSLEAHS